MADSTATTDSLLRQAYMLNQTHVGERARRSVGQHPAWGCLPSSRFHALVSQRDLPVS